MTTSGQPYRRRLLVNTASAAGANVWAMVVGLVSLPLLLRGLGTAPFGIWVLLQTFSALNGWLSVPALGIGMATTRSVAEAAAIDDTHRVGPLIASSMTLFATVGAAAAALMAAVGPAVLPALFSTPDRLRDDLRFAAVAFAAQLLFELLAQGCHSVLEGFQRIDLARLVDAVRRTLVAAATIPVALAGGGLRGVAVAAAVATAAGTLLAAAVAARHGPHARGRPALEEVRAIVAYGWTVSLLTSTGVLHRTMDRLIVGAALGPSSVALIEVATQLANGASAILSASSYATISSAPWLRSRGDDERVAELLDRGTRYSLLVTLPAVVGVAVLAGPLVRLWAGDRYSEAAGLTAVAVAYIGMAAPLQVGSNLLQGIGRAALVLRAAALAVAVNLGASLVLVEAVGLVGPLIGTLIGTAVLLPPLARAATREAGTGTGAFVRSAVLPVVPPAVAMAGASGAVVLAPLGDGLTLVIGAVVGLAAYVVVARVVALGRGEVRELVRLISPA